MKDRSITENLFPSQEIILDIRLIGKPSNIVIKLDMTKAYDNVEWKFQMRVLEKLGFDSNMVDKIWKLLANN